MNCNNCKDTGWILYQKEAPSPPYKQGQFFEYGARCNCKDGFKTERDRKS